jgi:mono/diheme cytochrome c family protein
MKPAWLFSVCAFTFLAILPLPGMLQTPGSTTPAAGITGDDQDLAAGKQLYDEQCRSCHRKDGKGTMEEMNLTDDSWKHGSTAADIEKVIREGINGTAMKPIAGEPTDAQIKSLVRFVQALSEKKDAVPPVPPAPPIPPVPPPH